ncbi:MAG: AI-2E family transporter [Phycisphaerales bacterium]|nr:AI-2E family transporter [Phycisphaerales bacterium]
MSEPASTPRPPAPTGIDWRTLHIWQIQPLRDIMLIAAVLGVAYLGYLLSIVTVPLLLALLLAYLVEPVVSRVTRSGHLSRPFVAAALIIIALLAVATPVVLGLGVGALQGAGYVQQQASNIQSLVRSVEKPADAELESRLPGPNWIKLRDWIVDIKAEADMARATGNRGATDPAETPSPRPSPGPTTPQGSPPAPSTEPASPPVITPPTTTTTPEPNGPPENAERRSSRSAVLAYQGIEWAVQSIQKHGTELGATLLKTSAGAITGGFGVVSWLFMLGFGAFLTSFFFFFVCCEYERVVKFLKDAMPEQNRERALLLASKMDRAISGFVRGRLTICAVLVAYYTLAYWAIGTSVPLILGPVVGLLTLIPYVSGIGVPVAILLLFLQPADNSIQSQMLWIVGAPIVVYAIGQFIDDYILTPRIQGQNTGMDTPTILFASIAGGVLLGFYGLLLAIPIAACVKITIQEVVWPRFKAWREGKAADPLPLPTAPSAAVVNAIRPPGSPPVTPS